MLTLKNLIIKFMINTIIFHVNFTWSKLEVPILHKLPA